MMVGLGLVFLALGFFLFLLAIGMIPSRDDTFGAPRWIIGTTRVAIGGVIVAIPGWITTILDRVFVALFAMIFDAIVIAVWWVLLTSFFAGGAAPRGPAGPR